MMGKRLIDADICIAKIKDMPITYDAETVQRCIEVLSNAPTAQPEEVIPHRNYKYLSDWWCECGWHLGKKGEVKYCSECGKKVNWDDRDC